mmetsp:Transcript_58551/g.156736  ORF Transcript_58551/g.156736 Transcript_58551/m.156736 type:complete len:395 (-) Transcript_58551:85-1269(-)|eukprot:CAMPEP_0171209042 /NCGR_PEP_ID=MMETSP0790-20130122/28394_1 /TAXON_ID=2925 /ORGANISM="Alexandrium catenella, Strain OF101" /LENGTH=394 /DNA_ID=CAMNT_0011674645 /DNA_START=65 /DNA_END=1249 /DNA_ORIENTATION=+
MASRSSAAALLLLAASLLAPASAVHVHLQGSTGLQAKTQRLQAVLGTHSAQLGKAIWDELGLGVARPMLGDMVLDAARGLLAQEADFLSAEDALASDILHGYARSDYLPQLIMGFEPLAPRAELMAPVLPHRLAAAAREPRTLESSESYVMEDAEGRLVRTTRHCRGNMCETETVEVPTEDPESVVVYEMAPEEEMEDSEEEEIEATPQEILITPEQMQEIQDYEQDSDDGEVQEEEVAEVQDEEVAAMNAEAGSEAADMDDSMAASMADAVGSAVRVAARSMAKEMKQVMQDSGLPPLGTVMEEMLNGTWAGGPTEDLSVGNLSDASFGDANVTEAFQDLANTFGGLIAPSPLTDAESVSTMTTFENGHMVRRTRRCKQGQCTTTTEEGESRQ